MTTEENLSFENPPVIETVISVQFRPIAGFTSGHFGWFWKQSLDPSWVKTVEAPFLPDQFERFGEQQILMPSAAFQFLIPANQTDRLQIVNSEDDRVVQLQISRFAYNWRKRGAVYPRFKEIYPEFLAKFDAFQKFLRLAELEPPSLNQWEITYINHIYKGELWQTTSDWAEILPGVFPPPREADEVRFESAAVQWHFEITPKKGRLHISAEHGRVQEGGGEVLALQLTARGPLEPDDLPRGLDSGLNLGHRALIRTFAGIASQKALSHWGIRK
jgi:uncharacterized protein (TIGR04255 family)